MARSPSYAFVTLLTDDSYLPGALTLVAALNDVHANLSNPPHPPFQTVCIVTPETVSVETRRAVMKAFDLVVGVDVIREDTAKGLNLLGRPDLHLVLTKLHVFRLTQFDKIIFLDADILPVRPISQLFCLPHTFSAVPDVGWPDIFNSGFMVFQPGESQFKQVLDLVRARGSWDGGDQGILNEWRGNDWNRLSFTYNTTPTAAYTYAPAYERFGSEIKAIHFIGTNKPWKSLPWRAPGSASVPSTSQSAEAVASFLVQPTYGYSNLVDKWFAVYDTHYRPAIPSEAQKREMKIVEIPRYHAAWDEKPKRSIKPPKPPTASDANGDIKSSDRSGGATMDVDQLKTLGSGGWAAVEAEGYAPGTTPAPTATVTVAKGLPDMGLGYVGPASEKGEAQYIAMPLDPHNQLKPIQEESVLYAYPFVLVPSEPPPATFQPVERFVEPPEWAPPATATSEPPAHLFRPAPSFPAPPDPPQSPVQHQRHGRQHSSGQSSLRSPQPHPHPHQHGHSHHRTPSHSGQHHPLPASPPGSVSFPKSSQQQSQSQYPHSGAHAPQGPSHSPPSVQWPQSQRQLPQQSPPQGSPGAIAPQPHHPSRPARHHHAQQQHYHRHYHHPTRGPLDGEHGMARPSSPSSGGELLPGLRHSARTSPTHHQSSPHVATREFRSFEPPRQSYFRPSSPEVPFEAPMETWNPAREPPPNILPPNALSQPSTTTIKNVWDMPRHQAHRRSPSPQQRHQAQPYYAQPSWAHHDYSTSDHSPAPPPPEHYPDDFFRPPTPPSIPSQLVREGHYHAVMSANAEPDSSKVAPVFPWESRARPPPARIFPRSEGPPPILAPLRTTPAPTAQATHKTTATVPGTMTPLGVMTPSPTTITESPIQLQRPASPKPKHITRAFSHDWRSEQATPAADFSRAGFGNAWDHVPSINRYAKRLVEPAPGPSALQSTKNDPGKDVKAWSERIEESDAASHEADDEDDESDLEPRPGSGVQTPSGDGRRSGKRSPLIRVGSGRGTSTPARAEKSVATTYSSKGIGTLQYRSQSVQTVPKSTQSRGVQVNRPPYMRKYRSESSSASPVDRRAPLPEVPAKPGPPEPRPPKMRTVQNVAFAPTPPDLPTREASPTVSPPGGVISPRMADSTGYMAFKEQLRKEGFAPSPTITTPAADAFTSAPFPRTSMISTGSSSNRNSAMFSSGPNRDSLYSDTQTTPRSSVILSSVPFPISSTPHIRTSSNETGLTGPNATTPPSSIGPSSPAEDDATIRGKKVSVARQWDPRRNVDLFKSQSQDVLARFLKMGGWDPDDSKQSVTPT